MVDNHMEHKTGRAIAALARHGAPGKFLLVGGANTAVGLAVIYGSKGLGVSDVPANVLGYAAGLCLSFALNKSWTFRYRGPTASALIRFLLVFAVAYGLNLATVLQAIDRFGANAYLAQALGIVPYTVFMYLASRHFAFRASRAAYPRARSDEAR